MPITYSDRTAVFAGSCAPEEADGLLGWLRRTPEASADLAACGELHTALAQLLLAARVRLRQPQADPVLAACLAAAVPADPIAGLNEPPLRSRVGRSPIANIKVPP